MPLAIAPTLVRLEAAPDLVDQVYRSLLDAISEGSLAPGQRITQDDIARQLAVSRQPVPQALSGPTSRWTRRRTRTGFARRWKRCSSADQDPGAGTGIAADFKGVNAAGCTSSRPGTSCA